MINIFLKIQRPKLAFPSVFTTIDLCMRHAFDKVECTDIVEGAPSDTSLTKTSMFKVNYLR